MGHITVDCREAVLEFQVFDYQRRVVVNRERQHTYARGALEGVVIGGACLPSGADEAAFFDGQTDVIYGVVFGVGPWKLHCGRDLAWWVGGTRFGLTAASRHDQTQREKDPQAPDLSLP